MIPTAAQDTEATEGPEEEQETVEVALGDVDEDSSREERDAVTLGVWQGNWSAVQVFCDCQWQVVGGFSRPYYEGITAQEVRAACLMHRIPRDEWPRVLLSISRVMVPAAKSILNEPSTR